MSKAKFTSGDWQWEHDNETACTISVFNFNGVEICRLQSEDYAHLIAAAPELYAELSSLIGRATFHEKYPVEAKRIEKLLAKARGE